MESGWDFVEWLGPDTSAAVLTLLDASGDLVRAAAVSRAWRRFVISNGFCKNLCLRICPELSRFSHVIEANNSSETDEVGSSTALEWDYLVREHKIYSYLTHCMVSQFGKRDCVLEAISASSTDNYPDESIDNTLEPSERVDLRPSYWSSDGEKDAGVPETLTYRLTSKLCMIDEIKIRPFRAYFQHGYPIYSAKAVRFRMGYSRFPENNAADTPDEDATGRVCGDNYIWTFISPVYPMAQENTLQSFKLPRPAMCIGGIVQIELLGRVQQQEMDGLYYICVCHVQVVGRHLSPAFSIDLETTGGLVLKYSPEAKGCSSLETSSGDEHMQSSGWHAFTERIRQLGAGRGWNPGIIHALLGVVPVVEVADDNGSDEEP